jgi:hypothetical protein
MINDVPIHPEMQAALRQNLVVVWIRYNYVEEKYASAGDGFGDCGGAAALVVS